MKKLKKANKVRTMSDDYVLEEQDMVKFIREASMRHFKGIADDEIYNAWIWLPDDEIEAPEVDNDWCFIDQIIIVIGNEDRLYVGEIDSNGF